jgi:hypothetical protein
MRCRLRNKEEGKILSPLLLSWFVITRDLPCCSPSGRWWRASLGNRGTYVACIAPVMWLAPMGPMCVSSCVMMYRRVVEAHPSLVWWCPLSVGSQISGEKTLGRTFIGWTLQRLCSCDVSLLKALCGVFSYFFLSENHDLAPLVGPSNDWCRAPFSPSRRRYWSTSHVTLELLSWVVDASSMWPLCWSLFVCIWFGYVYP